MAIDTHDPMFKSGGTAADAWGLREVAHRAMIQFDLPRTNGLTASMSGDAMLRFGRFCVLPHARQLQVDGHLIELGSRAFDLLMVLIGAPGTVVTKKEIMNRVWPDTVVEDSNLKVQMSALRKVLTTDRDVIKTVHGRGYVFTNKVTATSMEPGTVDRLGLKSALPIPPTSSSGWGSRRRRWATESRMLASDDGAQPVVVVIDEDPEIRDALSETLRAAGLCVESFACIQEFLDDAPPDFPGCLVLDVRLPGQSGIEVQKKLAETTLRLPIIFLSSQPDIPISVRAMTRGAIEFLIKPVRDRNLLDAVQLAIAQDRARRDAEQAVANSARMRRYADAA